MVMTWTKLVASKGAAGSLANWVNYSKLDTETVLDEAQSLLFQLLRVREMRTVWTFGMAVNQSEIALPSRFLDPIGRMTGINNMLGLKHILDTSIEELRAYDSSPNGDFDPAPFTTTLNSSLVAVELVGHNLSQGSTLTITDAAVVGGLDLNGTFPVTAITDADNLVIDAGEQASSAATGGGSLAEYTANKLITSSPGRWAIYEEKVMFDAAFDTASQFRLLYFRSPVPLSVSNDSNWLTLRYPKLLRTACVVAAADYMKDTAEYQKNLSALTALVQSTSAENDLMFRGAEFGTDTPTPGDYY